MKKNHRNLAIVVLSGGIYQDSQRVWWTSTYGSQGDNFGIDGARLRIAAAKFLADDNPEAIVIASGGGKGQGGQFAIGVDAPFLSAVLKRELLGLGVRDERIVEENRSIDTLTQLMEVSRLLESLEVDKLKLISNGWHLPRIKAIIEAHSELGKLKTALGLGDLEFIDADELLLKRDPSNWQQIIETARSSQAYQDRLAIEKRGVADILTGQYRFRH